VRSARSHCPQNVKTTWGQPVSGQPLAGAGDEVALGDQIFAFR
jgi:hypothetical protein